MGKDKKAFAQEVPKHLICSLCFEVFEDPLQCLICKNVSCKECVETWFVKWKKHECPLSGEHASLENFTECPKIFQNEIKELECWCRFKENGCISVFWNERVKEHEKNCDFEMTKCKWKKNGCKVSGLRENIRKHEQQCVYEKVSCENEGCEQKIMKRRI